MYKIDRRGGESKNRILGRTRYPRPPPLVATLWESLLFLIKIYFVYEAHVLNVLNITINYNSGANDRLTVLKRQFSNISKKKVFNL